MSESNSLVVHEIATNEIKFFVRRKRTAAAYARLKQSIKSVGLRQPIHVRDITAWSESDRRRKDGGLFKYELICGQGRLQAFRELKLAKIPALIIQVPESEIVGRFLAENVMRKRMSWYERAQLVRDDVARGLDVDAIKDKYFITSGQVYKYLRILRHASPNVRTEVEKLSMNDAEVLTSLDPAEQEIVVDVMKEENLGADQIESVVKKTRELKQKGKVTKNSLRRSIRDVQSAIDEARKLLKVKRLHWDLGPGNLVRLLGMPEFKAALEREEINYKNFSEAVSVTEEL